MANGVNVGPGIHVIVANATNICIMWQESKVTHQFFITLDNKLKYLTKMQMSIWKLNAQQIITPL